MSAHLILNHLMTYGAFLAALRLVTGAFGAWLTYSQEVRGVSGRSLGGYLAYCFPKRLFTMQSVRFDAYFFFIARFEFVWLFAAAAATTAFVVPLSYHALVAVFGPQAQHATTVPLQIALVLMCILVRDFGEFASHAIMHRYDFLWEFHKVHHSSLLLTPLGAKRAHFVEDVLRVIPNSTAVAISIGVFSYVFHLGTAENTLFGIDAYALFNILSFEILRHSHIPLSWGKLEKVLMSPLQHHVHHNRDGKVHNFGSFLAIWDQLNGSFSMSLPKGSFAIGLGGGEQEHYDSLAKLLLLPFWKSAKILMSSGFRQWGGAQQSLPAREA